MSRALFMCRQNVMNAVAVFIKCVVDIEDRTARVAENGVNALLYERVDQDLRTVLYHAKPPPFYVLHTVYTVLINKKSLHLFHKETKTHPAVPLFLLCAQYAAQPLVSIL